MEIECVQFVFIFFFSSAEGFPHDPCSKTNIFSKKISHETYRPDCLHMGEGPLLPGTGQAGARGGWDGWASRKLWVWDYWAQGHIEDDGAMALLFCFQLVKQGVDSANVTKPEFSLEILKPSADCQADSLPLTHVSNDIPLDDHVRLQSGSLWFPPNNSPWLCAWRVNHLLLALATRPKHLPKPRALGPLSKCSHCRMDEHKSEQAFAHWMPSFQWLIFRPHPVQFWSQSHVIMILCVL